VVERRIIEGMNWLYKRKCHNEMPGIIIIKKQ
jgi:hypothetical protein